MTLQELIGELLALSNAYPDATPIVVDIESIPTGVYYECECKAVEATSGETGVVIHIKGLE
jgi:hypothetical protein